MNYWPRIDPLLDRIKWNNYTKEYQSVFLLRLRCLGSWDLLGHFQKLTINPYTSVFSCYFINLLIVQLLHMTFSSSDHGILLALNISLTLPKSSSPFRAQVKCTTSPKPYPTRGLIEAQASQLLGHFGWFHWGWHMLTCIRIIYCVTYN